MKKTLAPAKPQAEKKIISFNPFEDPQKEDINIATYSDGSIEEYRRIWSASGPDDCYGSDSITH